MNRVRNVAAARFLIAVLVALGLVVAAAPQQARPAQAASNPIVAENQQPGTGAWRIAGPQADDVTGQIKGYASATSVSQNQSIVLNVTVNPAQTYTIDFYRIGWYGGLGSRLMLHVGSLNGVPQPACPVVDANTGLIVCSWSPGYTLTVPGSWTSGIYLALLTNAQGYQNYVTFVVTDGRPAAFLFQEPVTTYEAYNNYPNNPQAGIGKSLYNFNSYGANTVNGNAQAVKVSFDRPYAADGAGQVLYWDVYLVRWLERNGYDVTYDTAVDTHATGGLLLSSKGFISSAHDEYWSMPMLNAAQNALGAGVNLGFFGADAAFWQIRFESSAAGAANRVVVCYKAASTDPVWGPTTTVMFRKPPVNLPEQTLEGVQFTSSVNLGAPLFPYVVTNSSHWVYAGTGFNDGTSVPGIVGYEMDRLMSPDFPGPNTTNQTLLSHSPFTDSGGVADYANSSIYQAPSGAWVFAAGTIGWSLGLENFKPGDNAMNAGIQQTTANVLNAFVNGAPVAQKLGLTVASPSVTAGQAFNLTATALNAQGTPATTYRGTVHFTSTDPASVLPADYTFTSADAGAHQFPVTLKTAGSQGVTATDTATASITGSQTLTVTAAAAATLSLSGLTSTVAGTIQTATVTLFAADGTVATGYTGTVHFSSTDALAVLPADYTFGSSDAGVHPFSVTLKTTGGQTVSAADTANGALTGSQTVTVSSAPAATLGLSGLSSTTAGTVQTATVTAFAADGTVSTGYTGTVHFSSSDALAALPPDYTFTGSDGGVHQFPVTLTTAGSQAVTAADISTGSLSASQTLTISPATAATLSLSGLSGATAGAPQTATVTLVDRYGNVATGYAGAVHFSSTDALASLPADYSFTGADAGVHQFSVTLKKAGSQSVTATDSGNGSLTASRTLAISPAAATSLTLSGLSSTTAGTGQTATVALSDPYGNVASGYTGTVRFSSSDVQAALPASYTFNSGDAGVHQFSVTLKTAGTQAVTTRDTATASLAGTQTIQITAASAATIRILVPSTAKVNQPFSATVSLTDQFGNVATGYRGTIHFTSSDLVAQTLGDLPSDYTFSSTDAGSHTFSVKLATVGSQTITVRDAANGALTVTSGSITVTLM
jgi:N,N-dimethylformamidase beta subunit-like protein